VVRHGNAVNRARAANSAWHVTAADALDRWSMRHLRSCRCGFRFSKSAHKISGKPLRIVGDLIGSDLSDGDLRLVSDGVSTMVVLTDLNLSMSNITRLSGSPSSFSALS
jgi:hypothetical protein